MRTMLICRQKSQTSEKSSPELVACQDLQLEDTEITEKPDDTASWCGSDLFSNVFQVFRETCCARFLTSLLRLGA